MINESDLAHFIGSEEIYYANFKKICYTEGVKYLKDNGVAWLVDDISIHLALHGKKISEECDDMVFFTLTKREDNSALLEGRKDEGFDPVVSQEIEYTDMPLDELKIWASNMGGRWLLMLPSEY